MKLGEKPFCLGISWINFFKRIWDEEVNIFKTVSGYRLHILEWNITNSTVIKLS